MQTDLVHTDKDAAQADAGRVMLPVEGMECAACAVRIERQLAKVPGVREAVVNYATGEAAVAYEPGGDVATFVGAVEKAGFGVRTETLALPLREDAAPSMHDLEALFARTNGVLDVRLTEDETPSVQISYVPVVAEPATLARMLAERGYTEPLDEAALDAGRSAIQQEREAHYRDVRRRFIIAGLLSLPVLVISMSSWPRALGRPSGSTSSAVPATSRAAQSRSPTACVSRRTVM